MAEFDGQEKTEQPSHKKLKEGRDKGQVAKSVEINSLAVFLSGLLLLYMTQSFISSRISGLASSIFGSLESKEINIDLITGYALQGFAFFFITTAPVLAGILVIGFAANVSQVGINFSLKALAPKMDRFNPLAGIKKIFFSARSFVEVLKALLKLFIIGLFTYYILDDLIGQSSSLAGLDISEIASFMVDSAYSFLWKVAVVYALLAATDFIFQRYKFHREMMMTKQELKEENKQTEGDPHTKSRIRKIQLSVASRRMMQNVPKADVIITNPTHYAVAVKYEMNKDSAPRVTAKGTDNLALKIKEIAAAGNVPLHEDRELARALYKHCDVGDQIPVNLFKAVAQILAYIYQLKTARKKKSII